MTLENAAFAFDCGKWGKVLVLSLEFAPRDEVLDWAKKLLESKKYKDSKAIILTHSVLRVKKGLKTSIVESEVQAAAAQLGGRDDEKAGV